MRSWSLWIGVEHWIGLDCSRYLSWLDVPVLTCKHLELACWINSKCTKQH